MPDRVAAVRVLHRDDLMLALDKPAGMVTVPGRGTATALSALAREIAPGAMPVHRLDRETSGVVVFGIGPEAHRALNAAFEGRRVEKRYLALVRGDLAAPVRCDLALSPARRGRMRVAEGGDAQEATTAIEPVERFGAVTLCACLPLTGRTHQIRVHLAAIGHPLLVDAQYGAAEPILRGELYPGCDDPAGVSLARTPLHASALRLPHPSGRGYVRVESPLAADLASSIELLRAARRAQPLA
jgi:tRNA pseudouridine32 synthase/23S rRNA pseudouridine746 synthase/23S rRNA pseudouridine955/2504/2580 synthase